MDKWFLQNCSTFVVIDDFKVVNFSVNKEYDPKYK